MTQNRASHSISRLRHAVQDCEDAEPLRQVGDSEKCIAQKEQRKDEETDAFVEPFGLSMGEPMTSPCKDEPAPGAPK